MANVWKVNHYQAVGGSLITDAGYIAPQSLQFDLVISGASSLSYGVSLEDTRYISHDWVSPYAHDFQLILDDGGVFYADKVLLEGIITGHGIVRESGLSMVRGADYYHYFELRGYPFDPTLPDPYPYTYQWISADVATVINDMVTQVLAMPNSLDGVTLTLPTTGDVQDFQIQFGDTSMLSSFIESFANAYPGFDFRFMGNRTFQIFPLEYDPSHTPVHIFTENLDGSIDGVTAGPDWNNNGPLGTHAAGTGAGIGTQVFQNYEYVPSSALYRRIDVSPNFGNIASVAEIQRATAGALGVALNPVYEISMTVDASQIPGFFNAFVPGAYVFLNIDLKAHQLDGNYKIVKMSGVVSNEGQAIVELGMNRETNLSSSFADTNP